MTMLTNVPSKLTTWYRADNLVQNRNLTLGLNCRQAKINVQENSCKIQNWVFCEYSFEKKMLKKKLSWGKNERFLNLPKK